jgi:hypothetical protein
VDITQDYEDLQVLLREHGQRRAEVRGRVMSSPASMLRYYKVLPKAHTPYLLTAEFEAMLRQPLKEHERQDPLFAIATSRRYLAELARVYLAEHAHITRGDVRGLLELYEEHKTTSVVSVGKQMLAIVLSVGAFVGQSIPEEVFEYLHWGGYAEYRFYLALFTVGSALYVLLAIGFAAALAARSNPSVDTKSLLLIIESQTRE